MMIEHAKDPITGVFLHDAAGNPVRRYHFTEPRLEGEFIHRMDDGGLTPDQAYASMCNCDTHVCLAHGVRNDPYPHKKLEPHETGAGMFIRQHKDDANNWTTDLVFSRLDLVVEAKKRIDSGMSALEAYHSMCQCYEQICAAHGARLEFNAKTLADNPDLRVRYERLLSRRLEQVNPSYREMR